AIPVGLRIGQLCRRNTRGVHSDEGVPSAQLRLGCILVHQLLRTAFLMESNGFHGRSLADCTSIPSVPSVPCLSEACGSLLVSLPTPPKQFVHGERDIGAHSEEQRSPGSRKHREIEGRLHSQRHRHRKSKGGQKSPAEQGNDASVPPDNEEKTEQRLSRRGDHRHRWNRRRGQKPIERGRIVYESSIVAPRHIGLSINAPEAKSVCDSGQERGPEREA